MAHVHCDFRNWTGQMTSEFFKLWTAPGGDYLVSYTLDNDLQRVLRGGDSLLKNSWQPPKLSIIPHERGRKLQSHDFLIGIWGGALLFRESVFKAMGEMLAENGEVLPVDLEGSGRTFIHNTRYCDCLLDAGPQSLEKTHDIQRDWRIFDQEKCSGRDLFRLPQEPAWTYVSDRFVREVKEHGLTGARFSTTERF